MSRTLPRRFWILVAASALAIALLLGARTIIHRNPNPHLIQPDATHEGVESASRLEAVEPSEELVSKHPFIYAGIHLDKIYELNFNSRTFTADGEI